MKVAWPLPLSSDGPERTVAPSLNVTVPSVTGPASETVAVNVTAWPNDDGLMFDTINVVVFDLLTFSAAAVEVAVPQLFEKTARYWYPFSEISAVKDNV